MEDVRHAIAAAKTLKELTTLRKQWEDLAIAIDKASCKLLKRDLMHRAQAEFQDLKQKFVEGARAGESIATMFAPWLQPELDLSGIPCLLPDPGADSPCMSSPWYRQCRVQIKLRQAKKHFDKYVYWDDWWVVDLENEDMELFSVNHACASLLRNVHPCFWRLVATKEHGRFDGGDGYKFIVLTVKVVVVVRCYMSVASVAWMACVVRSTRRRDLWDTA